MAERSESKVSNGSNFRNDLIGLGVIGVVGIGALGGALYATREKPDAITEPQVETALQQDGFNNAEVTGYNFSDGREVRLALGNCALDVNVHVEKVGNTVDVTNYTFSHDNATFVFQNSEELTAQILGSEPCKTLA